MKKNISVIIPMAGMGKRFADAGYSLPKPLIKIFGKPMIKLVVDSLGIDANYIFLVQKRHYEQYGLKDMLETVAPGCTIVQVDGTTDGAARTVLLAKSIIDNDTPLLIANSDQVIVWDSFAFTSLLASGDVVAVFEAQDPKWSYSKIEHGKIVEIAEKQVISNSANVGVYGWSKGSDYVKYAEQMIEKDIRTNDEFYIAPVYNEAILDGRQVLPFYVEEMHGLGTPEDMNSYIEEKING